MTETTHAIENHENEDADAPSDWLTASIRRGVRLIIHGGSRDGERITIDRAGEHSLGRSSKATVSFSKDDATDKNISREHAVLKVDGKGVTLANLEPRNGLFLLGEEIPRHTETALKDLDVFQLGRGGPRIEVRIGDVSAFE